MILRKSYSPTTTGHFDVKTHLRPSPNRCIQVKPRRFVAKLSYRGRSFASVPIEVSTVEAGNADQFDALTSEALGLVGVPAT